MSDLVNKLNTDYLLGCIKYRDTYFLYALPIGWWILNYSKYDPAFASQGDASEYRNGVLNVVDSEVQNFIEAIESDKVSSTDFKLAINLPAEYRRLIFFVDFDGKLFINGYFDNVEPEQYLPDFAWRGELGYPSDFLPNEFRIEFEGLS